jgi:DNA-binding protein HU-beta
VIAIRLYGVESSRSTWPTRRAIVPGGHVPNKAQFIELLADKFDGDKRMAAAALDAVIETVYANVAKGEKVALTGFGIFEKRERAARIARNPATGAAVKVKKTSVPAFRAGAEFKAITSGEKKVASTTTARRVVAATKAPAKKAVVKKVAAKKAPAKKAVVKKVAAKKAPAKKAAVKKVAAKKAPAKKAAVKRVAAKKAPAKKAAVKRVAAKKAPAKRAPARKAAR